MESVGGAREEWGEKREGQDGIGDLHRLLPKCDGGTVEPERENTFTPLSTGKRTNKSNHPARSVLSQPS